MAASRNTEAAHPHISASTSHPDAITPVQGRNGKSCICVPQDSAIEIWSNTSAPPLAAKQIKLPTPVTMSFRFAVITRRYMDVT